jgi:hypothetical protein
MKNARLHGDVDLKACYFKDIIQRVPVLLYALMFPRLRIAEF